jgi:membrane protease YdiL (CAAX protease family)
MDRRLLVISLVSFTEVLFRYFAEYVPVNTLTYTLAVRVIQMALILSFSLQYCGVLTARLFHEIYIGITVAVVFGILVFLTDLSSRLVIHSGLLSLLIAKQPVDNPLLFFLTGCMVGPFVEELFFRGLLYSWMRQRTSLSVSIILSSLLFASLHGTVSPVQLIGGLLFASIFEWRKNIWAPFAVHCLANVGIWLVPYLYPFM